MNITNLYNVVFNYFSDKCFKNCRYILKTRELCQIKAIKPYYFKRYQSIIKRAECLSSYTVGTFTSPQLHNGRQLNGGENRKLTMAQRNSSHYVIFKSETLMCNSQLVSIKCKFKKTF